MIVRPLIALVVKDLRVFFSERHSMILSFAAPIALASFMAAIFGGAGSSAPSRIAIVLVDEDRSAVSASIVEGARSDPRLVVVASNRLEGLATVRTGKSVAAVVIPKGFGEAASNALLGDAEPPALTFFLDPTHRAEISLAEGLLTRVVLEAVSAESLGDLGGDLIGDLSPSGPARAVERAEFLQPLDGSGQPVTVPPPKPARKGGLRMPYEGREVSITAGGAEGERGALAAHAFAGMVVQFVLFSAVEWGVGLLVERQRGLWKRLRVAPVSRNTLIAGKILGCLLSSLLITATVLGFGALAFGYPIQGSFLGLILMALAFSWMAANFGLMVASFGRSPQGARSVAVLAVLVMVMLGGGWIPGFLFPEWLQQITPIIPARWAIEGFDASISRGYSLRESMTSILTLFGFGATFGVAGLLAFRWSEPG